MSDEAIWTVGRLIKKLQQFPPDMPIVGIYDWEVAEDAKKNHRRMNTVTIADVVGLKIDGSREESAVWIETTGVLKIYSE